ncbi:MAG: hypothetical protein ABIE14_05685 [Patescibacteria group bacterium]
MKLSHLTEIVKNVSRTLTCPKCGKQFAGDTVDVVDITGDRGLFSAHCLHCNSATLVAMSIRDFRQKIAKRERQISKVAIGKISPADVVEMKNFLEDFDGDFKKVLTNPPQKKQVE